MQDVTNLNSLRFEPLTPSNWEQFTRLFGEKGACGNCWCMYHRLSKSDFEEGKVNEGNKQAMKDLVWAGKPTGAYPTIPTQEKLPDSFAWIGLFKSFERAGFEIVDTTSKNRPMVRYYVR